MLEVLTLWIAVTMPGGASVELNAGQIVSVRPPSISGHYTPDTRCIIHTADGKYVTTIESCDAIKALLVPPD